MGGAWVDLVVVVLVVGAVVRGWWVGGVLQTLTLGGFWVGVVLGFLVAPAVATLASGAARTVLLLLWLGVAALVGGLGGALLGTRLRRRVRSGRLAIGDRVLGAAVGALATMLALWLIGTLLAASAPQWLSGPLRQSAVLGAVDGFMPDPPSLFSRVESLLNHSGFPVVVVNLPPGLASPETLPGSAAVRAAGSIVEPSTVKVTGEACGSVQSGSGFVAGRDLVVTNAHVVAGETSTTVTLGEQVRRATPVVYDSRLDVAVLRVPGLDAPAATVTTAPVGAGATAAIAGFPQGGAFRAEPAAVNARFEAVGLDIYGNALTSRDVYELHGAVRPGNSGGPLVAAGMPAGGAVRNGTVIGVVFARAPSDPDVGYALAMAPVVADVAAAGTATSTASTGACAP